MLKQLALAGVLAAMFTGAAVLTAQDAQPAAASDVPGLPQMPEPTKEHAWLHQAVGEWDTEGEANMGPGQPAIKCTGTETVRALGKFWTITENTTTMMEMPMTGVMTLGYDPEKKKYIGTWVDSMTSHLWHYEGTVDAAGKVLTLEAEGPNPAAPGTTAKFRERIEFKSKDHKVFTSSMESDGQWVTFVTMNAKRKK